MDRGRWFVRAGTLVLILGFFMPTMLVSCSGMAGYKQSFSMADLASRANQAILYLFLFAAIVALIATFLPQLQFAEIRTSLYVQIGAIGGGLLVLIASLLSLSDQVNKGTYGLFEIQPDFGIFVLIGGLVLFFIGWWEQWSRQEAHVKTPIQHTPEYDHWVSSPPDVVKDAFQEDEKYKDNHWNEPVDCPARLEPIKGVLPRRAVTVEIDNFTIGRHSDNHLVILDEAVSRHHARLRYAEGVWFIQDCDSARGILVNGERVPAARLKTGDEIGIAGNTLIFRS